MKKRTLAGIAFCMGAGTGASATTVDLQALELLKENRISYQEYMQLTSKPHDSGTWSNVSLESGTWSNVSMESDTWSNVSVEDGTWSNVSLESSTWSNVSVEGETARPENVDQSKLPTPQIAKGVQDN